MLTSSVLARSVTLSLLLAAVAACSPTTTSVATETERTQCREWRDSLPSRSKNDTEQTKAEIGTSYDVYLAACGPLGFELPF